MKFNLVAKCLSISFGLVASSAFSHSHPAYLYDSNINYSNADWISYLSDEKIIKDLSIPGTHNSMSLYGIGDIGVTQTLSLKKQLKAGIRAFDIRLRAIENKLAVHHGPLYQKTMFGDVLNEMMNFIIDNPKEVLFVRVREEYKSENSTMSFEDIFAEYVNIYKDYIETNATIDSKLKDVRGKIIFLQNFFGYKFGLFYPSEFDVQDRYELKTNWELYSKWEDVKIQLEFANSNNEMSVNYLSASGGVFSYFVASGHSSPQTSAPRLLTGMTTPDWKNSYPDFPRVSCFIGICSIAFEGINVLTQEYIEKKGLAKVGMIMADFPGPALIETVINLNLPACKEWSNLNYGYKDDIYRYNNPYTKTVDYFKLKKTDNYWYFPTNQTSNHDWEYLGHKKICK